MIPPLFLRSCPVIYRDEMRCCFECPPGWLSIVEALSLKLEASTSRDEEFPLGVVQVKEKFGGLRFYVTYATDEQSRWIDDAERLSFRTCQECGRPGQLWAYVSGWRVTICGECRAVRERC